MIDTNRMYTEKEADALSEQGYEFVSAQVLGQRDPAYIVASYTPPRVTYDAVCRHTFAPEPRIEAQRRSHKGGHGYCGTVAVTENFSGFVGSNPQLNNVPIDS